jgi:molecular chaperone DnaK
LTGHTIEFVNETMQPHWRSGKIGLSPVGAFMTSLCAQKGPENKFLIELYDSTGMKVPTVPDHFAYVIMVVNTEQPLIHSMGVGLANNEMQVYFKKGEALPTRHRYVLRTATLLRRSQATDILRIPVLEGQNNRADRNHHVGSLEITGGNIQRDVPPGSEIEVTLEIDRSRLIRVKAYVPVLDEEFEDLLKLGGEKFDREKFQKDFERETTRLDKLRQKVKETCDPDAEKALFRIDGERMVHDVEAALAASTVDPDAADKCRSRLLDLRSALDEVGDRLEWPGLVADAEKEMEVERKIVQNVDFKVTSDEKNMFANLEREIRHAVSARDTDLLRRKIGEMDGLGLRILNRQPGFWVGRLEHLEKIKHTMTNQAQAENYLAQGRRAINNNDVEGLQAAVRQLIALLPAGEREQFSGVMR